MQPVFGRSARSSRSAGPVRAAGRAAPPAHMLVCAAAGTAMRAAPAGVQCGKRPGPFLQGSAAGTSALPAGGLGQLLLDHHHHVRVQL